MSEAGERSAPSAAPLNLPRAILALLLCQLAGETTILAVRSIYPEIAFPGPVVGMALMFLLLVWRKGPDAGLDATSSAILRNLSLLFVPAAVGIVQYGPVLSQFGLVLAAALIASTVLTLLVTVGVFLLVARLRGSGGE